jgi:hypothetical protein
VNLCHLRIDFFRRFRRFTPIESEIRSGARATSWPLRFRLESARIGEIGGWIPLPPRQGRSARKKKDPQMTPMDTDEEEEKEEGRAGYVLFIRLSSV